MPTIEREPWSKAQIAWASGVLGAILMTITLTAWAASIKSEAHDAKCGVDDLQPRVNTLEKHEAEDRADFRSSMKTLDEMRTETKEMRADVRKILERLPR